MTRGEIQGPIDDRMLNNINHNFIELYKMRNALQNQIDDIILDSGESNQEVAAARGGNRTLGGRLDNFDRLMEKANQDLKNKVEKGNIQKADYDLSKDANKWNINDFDEKTRKAILEAQGIDIDYVLGKSAVAKENIADRAVSNDKLEKSVVGKNLFDKTKVTRVLLSLNEDREYPNDEFYSSDYMPIKANAVYTPRYQCRIVFYRNNGEFISGAGEEHPAPELSAPVSAVESPSGARYARISFRSTNIEMLNRFQFEEGSSRTPTEPHHYLLKNTVSVPESRVNTQNAEFEYDNNGNLSKVIEENSTTTFVYSGGEISYIIISDHEFNTKKRVDFEYENGFIKKITERFL